MELQSLKNARKSWNFLLIATGLCLLAELHLLQWELKYVLPQAVIVLAASLYNIFLDTRDGNIYTAESANRKRLRLSTIPKPLIWKQEGNLHHNLQI